jgi:hypothetical protein
MGLIILGIIIGFVSGWIMLRALINYRMKAILDSIANTPLPQKELKTVDIDLVMIKDRIYAYDRSNQNFLAHGNTKAEIIDSLRTRFPDTSFMAKTSNLEDLGLK